MRHHTCPDKLNELCRIEDIAEVDFEALVQAVQSEPDIPKYLPNLPMQVDPRTGDRVVHCPARSTRPLENADQSSLLSRDETDPNHTPSFISKGTFTGAIDVAALSEGHTFLNMNLYPSVYPCSIEASSSSDTLLSDGMHLLQWTSTYQDRDWHNMPDKDCDIVMSRLAAASRTLLSGRGSEGYLTFYKNYGRAVGGSIAHGHQQLIWTKEPPGRVVQLGDYQRREGEPLTATLLRETPDNLHVCDFGECLLLVPVFMKRAFMSFLILKDTSKQYLHELNETELSAFTRGWCHGIRLMRQILPEIGRPIAYNILIHNGSGCGLHAEFVPYTQEMGGFEQMGLYVCGTTPEICAQKMRDTIISSD